MSFGSERKAFLQALMDAFNANDKESLKNFYTEDCVFIDPLNGMDGSGPRGRAWWWSCSTPITRARLI